MEFLEAKIQGFKSALVVFGQINNARTHMLHPNVVFSCEPGVRAGKVLHNSGYFAGQYFQAVQIAGESRDGIDCSQEKSSQAANLHRTGEQSIKFAEERGPRRAQTSSFTPRHIADVQGANQ